MENFEHESAEENLVEENEDLNSPENKVVINTKMNNLFNKANDLQPRKGYYFEYNDSTGEGTIQAGQYKLTFDRRVMEGYTKKNGSMRSDTYRDYSNIQLTVMPDASDDNNYVLGPKLIGEFKTMSDFNDKIGKMEGRLDNKKGQQTKNDIALTEKKDKEEKDLDERLDSELENIFA